MVYFEHLSQNWVVVFHFLYTYKYVCINIYGKQPGATGHCFNVTKQTDVLFFWKVFQRDGRFFL